MFFVSGFVVPIGIVVILRLRGLLTTTGATAGAGAMVLVCVWVWRDIASSHSSTAALALLAVPPLLFLIAAATVAIDRAVVLGRRFTDGRDDWSERPG